MKDLREATAESVVDRPSIRQRRWILLALMCTMMLAAMDSVIVSTAIPQIVGDLGGFSLFSWVFSVYLLAQTVTIPIYGKLSDSFGRKTVLLIGTVIFLLGSAASAAAWNMESLIVFRGLQGLGAGSIMATVETLAGDLYSVRERAAIQGWLSSVWGMAAISGPLLGGAFAEYLSWRWIFFVNVPFGIAAMALLGAFLHEHLERRAHRVDYGGSVLVLLTAGLLIFGLLQGGQAWPWVSWQSGLILVFVAVFAAALAWVEKHAAEPVMPSWLWHRRVLTGANLATVLFGVVLMAPEAYLPTYAQSVLGLRAIGAGLVLASMSIGWPLASSLSGPAYLKVGFRATTVWGAILVVIAVALFAFYAHAAGVWSVVGSTVLLGVGFGLLSTPILVGIQSVVRWEQRGVATGANMFCRYLGSSIGVALMGAIYNGTLRNRLAQAPQAIRDSLPTGIDELLKLLLHGSPSLPVRAYLRDVIDAATVNLYITGVAVAILMLLAVFIMPKHFAAAPSGAA
ncbi:MAG TPA: MDR family MFS transporter [Nevskiaceae bacterium]|nr:MDR family MFS transporter [Nevskiaceae bacterium]